MVCKKRKQTTRGQYDHSYVQWSVNLSRDSIDGKTKKRKTERDKQEGLKGREFVKCAILPQLEEAVCEKIGANTQSTEKQTSHFTFTEYG